MAANQEYMSYGKDQLKITLSTNNCSILSTFKYLSIGILKGKSIFKTLAITTHADNLFLKISLGCSINLLIINFFFSVSTR